MRYAVSGPRPRPCPVQGVGGGACSSSSVMSSQPSLRGPDSSRPVVQDPLVEMVVLPPPGDEEVVLRHAVLLEAAAQQDPLRGHVVGQCAGLQAVQPQRAGLLDGVPDRCPRQPAARVGVVDPVAERRALEDPAHDVVEVHPAHDVGSVHHQPRDHQAQTGRRQLGLDVVALAPLGEEGLVASRVPGGEVLPVAQVRRGQRGSVVLVQRPDLVTLGQHPVRVRRRPDRTRAPAVPYRWECGWAGRATASPPHGGAEEGPGSTGRGGG